MFFFYWFEPITKNKELDFKEKVFIKVLTTVAFLYYNLIEWKKIKVPDTDDNFYS